ncbi:MAG: type III-B CRISPR module RAMP protein Cmr6 [Chloroflexota bacterium]|nr:type III-B CRISPR module RAMP protein Cmr6 [Chloroflexota bacterium]
MPVLVSAATKARLLANGKIKNVGLALDRYLEPAGDNDAKADYAKRWSDTVQQPVPKLYGAAFDRWQAALVTLPNVEARAFQVEGRMIVGIGAASVHETSIMLSRAYGVPFIPGSALKGLARHYAQRALVAASANPENHDLFDTGGEGEPNAYSILFGHQRGAARVHYFDAWYIPAPGQPNSPLHRDVITVHHQKYYGSQGRDGAPWDFDDPVPVPFVSASGDYLVAVQGPTPDWARFAADVLTTALEQWGIGAKTSSGYGRMTWPRPPSRLPHALIEEIQRMRPQDIRNQLSGKVDRWRTIADEEDRRAVAIAICLLIDTTPGMPKWAKNRPWAREVREYLASAEGQAC